MVYKPGITEKRLANKRFMRTEEAILRAFFDGCDCCSLDKIAARVGVARSTVYHHHKAIKEIIPDYERYILRRYRLMMRYWLRVKKNMRLRVAYQRMLIYVLQNRKFFVMLTSDGNRDVPTAMVQVLEAKVVRVMRLSRNSGKMFRVYTSEVVEVMMEWGERGFREGEIEEVLDDIMYLTENMKTRLGGLSE